MDTHGPCRYKGPKMAATAGERARAAAQPVSTTMPFSTLLYRYFLFGWLFKDVNRGNVLERAAAWRHNREQARWLPTYMRRWIWVAVSFLCAWGKPSRCCWGRLAPPSSSTCPAPWRSR